MKYRRFSAEYMIIKTIIISADTTAVVVDITINDLLLLYSISIDLHNNIKSTTTSTTTTACAPFQMIQNTEMWKKLEFYCILFAGIERTHTHISIFIAWNDSFNRIIP